ncbi:MAG: pyridoxal-dependent decarboxylase [Xanthobacteraceae bacterium]|nr:pyridoxal-dependent decarboxylase [Xanthobacteraceae bacterium]
MPRGEEDRALDLDPRDWDAFAGLGHRALDDMVGFLRTVRDRAVWVEAPDDVRRQFDADLPVAGRDFADVLGDFDRLIKPYATGNTHPAFMGWVHGAGTPVGMIAEMLAAGLNANCGGRNHIGIEVERQVTRWMQRAFRFPDTAAGVFVTGTSMANFLALLVARNHALGDDVRSRGIVGGPQLVAYASKAAHGCIAQAMQLSGLGSDHLRLVACGADGAMRLADLEAAVAADRRRGLKPFLVVGTAGSVDIGAIDPLAQLAGFCRQSDLWFHVDGAFGALLAFSPTMRPRIAGIELADSIAFDFHKWAHVPYDAGFVLVRDGAAQRRTFASANGYLTRSDVGLAAGETWPCDLGPDLSRGFRALKTWFTLQVFGTEHLGNCMAQTCDLAKYLEGRLQAHPDFALSAPVALNIVCFSATGADADARNRRIVERLHVSGRAAPSITLLDGKAVIRCAIVNHRTTRGTIDRFVSDLEEVARDLP